LGGRGATDGIQENKKLLHKGKEHSAVLERNAKPKGEFPLYRTLEHESSTSAIVPLRWMNISGVADVSEVHAPSVFIEIIFHDIERFKSKALNTFIEINFAFNLRACKEHNLCPLSLMSELLNKTEITTFYHSITLQGVFTRWQWYYNKTHHTK
jgi:hypothetical protein